MPWGNLETLELQVSDRFPEPFWSLRDIMEWQRKWSRMGHAQTSHSCSWSDRVGRQGRWQSALWVLVLICRTTRDIPGLTGIQEPVEPQVEAYALAGGQWEIVQVNISVVAPPSPSSHYPSTNSCPRKKVSMQRSQIVRKDQNGTSAKGTGKQQNNSW